MKRLLLALFSLPFFVSAQNATLEVEGVAPALYIKHTVAPKENYYSIGRIYNISPREIAPFNNLDMEKGLNLNQEIKIPLSQSNFLQEGSGFGDEVLVPVYHTVKGQEGLYRVSVNYNKVPVETIMKWNNLSSNTVPTGTRLIVGYLKVKKALSSLAPMGIDQPADAVASANSASKPAMEKPLEPVVEKTAVAIETPLPVKEKETVSEPLKASPEAVVKEEPAKKTMKPLSRKTFNGGVFKLEYEKQTQQKAIAAETGEGAIFKSTSGWEDGKYYCLHNNSAPGTILKITNTSTGKNVYAKVLDVIPDMKQNEGLLIRLSNAAADELGAGDSKFNCTINYSK